MRERVKTAIIFGAVFIPILVLGDLPLLLLTTFLAIRGLFELLRMINIPFFSVPSILAHLGISFIVFSDVITPFLPGFIQGHHVIGIMTLSLLVIATIHQRFTFIDAGITLIGQLYIGFGFYSLHYIRRESALLLIFIVLAIWASDIGAYMVGRRVGKRKLAPALSPNKTIEGSIGGILSAMLVGAIYISCLPNFQYNLPIGMLVAGICAISGQFGDLIESGMKREFKVKDSGRILPGHGGILDRFDSMIFTMTLVLLMGIV
ncbi:phosphatidate cytidylyltransferase [Dolosigranulum savutiense]|uniref:Phosphatidate cytidylyltransferase n=1 Tax=Dolosigranulum savutiense TaxID=3110288 RepID=A0AB74TWN9_9LACT